MLELRKITKRFGSVLANDRVDIKVAAGTIHAVIGENGAGKSTAMRIAYGFYRADSGEVIIDGKLARLVSPHDAIARGVGMVHQHFTLVDTMTVTENIILGAEPGNPAALDTRRAGGGIKALSDRYHFDITPDALIEDLSVGQQQRVELLKALYREARLLILDEPTAVLTPQEVEELFGILRRMREQGKTIVIITHKLAEVMAISDEVTVMRDGRVVGTRQTGKTNPAELARLMVGRDVLLQVEKTPAKPGPVVMQVRGIQVADADEKPRLDDVSFEVRAGEIVGIAGVEGNGQTELIEALSGLITPRRGEILIDGWPVTTDTVRHRKERGINHVPEDRHRRGLVLEFDLQENSILGFHYRKPVVRNRITLDRAAVRNVTNEILTGYDVRPATPELPARSLSGGNQQKLILGRELLQHPRVLLVSQPTRGVDIGAIEFIYKKLLDLRQQGCAILLVSAELEEVTSLSDRLLVIHAGKIVGELDPRHASVDEIGMLMTGGRTAAA